MKTFIAAVVTFVMLTAIVAANGIYLYFKTNELIAVANDFPFMIEGEAEQFCENAAKFKKTLDGATFMICLSVSHSEAEVIDEHYMQMKLRFEHGDLTGYISERSALICEITDLRKSESFTLRGIL